MRASRAKLGTMVGLFAVLIVVAFELNCWSRKPREEAQPAGEIADGEFLPVKPKVNTKEVVKPPEPERPDITPLAPGKGFEPVAVPEGLRSGDGVVLCG